MRLFHKSISLLIILTFLFTNNVYGLRAPLKSWLGEGEETISNSKQQGADVDEADVRAAINETAKSIMARIAEKPSSGVIINDGGDSSFGLSVQLTTNGKPSGDILPGLNIDGSIMPEARLVRSIILAHRPEIKKINIEPDELTERVSIALIENALLEAAGLSSGVAEESSSETTGTERLSYEPGKQEGDSGLTKLILDAGREALKGDLSSLKARRATLEKHFQV